MSRGKYSEVSIQARREDTRREDTRRDDELHGAHRHVKPNRKSKHARQKDWQSALDEDYIPRSERVMRRGEQERRAMVKAQALATLETVDEDSVEATWEQATASGETGMVVEVSSGLCRVAVNGHMLLCSLRGSLSAEDSGYTNLVAVGDRVTVTASGDDRGVIDAVLPRLSALARPDPFHSHLKQIIVANADQLLIVASWLEPPLWPELIDRYLIGAERNRLTPVLCVNKVDLAEDRDEVRTVGQAISGVGTSRPVRQRAHRGRHRGITRGDAGENVRSGGIIRRGQIDLTRSRPSRPGFAHRLRQHTLGRTGTAYDNAGESVRTGRWRLRGGHAGHPPVRRCRAVAGGAAALLPGDCRGRRTVSLRQLLAHPRTRLRRQSCAAAGAALRNALSQLLPDSGDVGVNNR